MATSSQNNTTDQMEATVKSDTTKMEKSPKKYSTMMMVLPQDTIKKMASKSMKPLMNGTELPSTDTTQRPEKTAMNSKMTMATGSAKAMIPLPEK